MTISANDRYMHAEVLTTVFLANRKDVKQHGKPYTLVKHSIAKQETDE